MHMYLYAQVHPPPPLPPTLSVLVNAREYIMELYVRNGDSALEALPFFQQLQTWPYSHDRRLQRTGKEWRAEWSSLLLQSPCIFLLGKGTKSSGIEREERLYFARGQVLLSSRSWCSLSGRRSYDLS